MSQDTRKDPRAKVLTMTVRYKSATLDEFIEHHSHDVSRGGMFIKTPSPFPPGTLLKFEVKIAEDKKVMQGVGRVVWKREAADSSADHPSGMGVKFIKIDEDSNKVIDQLIKGRDEGGAFEAGEAQVSTGGSTKPPPSMTPSPAKRSATPAPVAAAGGPKRKSTMIGLGAVSSPPVAPPKVSEPPKEKEAGSFFPKTESEKDLPPPEDRTVMKQAAELLKDALREAGGSMEEVGEAPAKKESAAPPAVEKKPSAAPEPEKKPSVRPVVEAKKPSERPAKEEPEPESGRIERKGASAPPAAAAAKVPSKPPAKPAVAMPIETPAAQASGGGSGKAVGLLVAVAVAAGAVFFLTREKPPVTPPTPPVETTQARVEPTPAPTPTPTPAPTPVATEEPAAGKADAAAAGRADAAPEKSAAAPKPAPPPVQPKPAPPPVQPKPAPPPVQPKPAPPPVQPKPAPPPVQPKPPPGSDNPY